ncbi:MAG TPA: glycosyltransferase [Vicinamibacterales bacterium]|nr:glycosyltransferase [Vicinamibacterales bacterium]
MLHVVINCGLCEDYIGRCLTSVRRQTHAQWRAHVTIDRSGDATFDEALAARAGDERIAITRNAARRFPMSNLISAIGRSGAAPDDVIVVLDGDDWLIDDEAFALIDRMYEETDCWVTYGSWISNRPERPGLWPPYASGTTDFRSEPWLGTAVRTWKRWLFDRIEPDAFRDARGNYLRNADDLACMFPLLEMATTERACHIERPLMFYNLLSPHDDGPELARESERNAEWLRSRPRYAPLPAFTNARAQPSS